MDSLIATFHIDWHAILAQAINFVLAFVVLYFAALKPLGKLMDERGKTISGGLENAKKQEELLKAQQAEYDKAITQARIEASNIQKEAKKNAEAYWADIQAKGQIEKASFVESGKKLLEAEKTKMLDEAKKELVTLVTSATEKVLGKTAEGKVETKLVEDSIKSI